MEINQPSSPTTATGASGTAPAAVGQTEATTLGVTTDANMPSAGGRFYSLYPLYDGTNRMLVSWAPCLIQTTAGTTEVCNSSNTTGANVTQAPPQYTVWIYDFSAGTLSPLLSAEQGMEVVEPVVLQARTPLPTYIPDFIPTTPAQEALVNDQVGILNISSVYDYDGVDTAKPNIATQANPGAGELLHPAGTLRAHRKGGRDPAEDGAQARSGRFRARRHGHAGDLGLCAGPAGRLGADPGARGRSVRHRCSRLRTAGASRAQHTSWMQVMPGETKSCNGCHTAGNLKTPSHGRSGLTVAVNQGAPTTGEPFPGTYSALFANAGETMAQTLERISCETGSALAGLPAPYTQPCSQILATDVIYAPIWTDTVTTPQADVLNRSLERTSSATPMVAPPASRARLPPTGAARLGARSAVSPSITRTRLRTRRSFTSKTFGTIRSRVATVNGVANTPVTCTLCHNPLSAQNKVQVPAGQLDLTGVASSGADRRR